MKRCSKCRKDLPLDSFQRDALQRSGLRCCCRSCYSLAERAQRGTNSLLRSLRRLLIAELRKRGYRLCRVCEGTKSLQSFNNKQTACRECHNAQRSAYSKTLVGRAVRARSDHKRRAAKCGAVAEDVDKRLVFERDNGLCGICNLEVDPGDWHLDHVVPLARGGGHTYDNVQVSHPRCNMVKGARLVS